MSNSFCYILARACFETCVGTIAFVSSIAFVIVSYAFVTMKFWNWFLVDIFDNAPEITLVQAIGLAFVLDIILNRSNKLINSKRESDYLADQSKAFKTWCFIAVFTTPWISLFFGWLFKSLCM